LGCWWEKYRGGETHQYGYKPTKKKTNEPHVVSLPKNRKKTPTPVRGEKNPQSPRWRHQKKKTTKKKKKKTRKHTKTTKHIGGGEECPTPTNTQTTKQARRNGRKKVDNTRQGPQSGGVEGGHASELPGGIRCNPNPQFNPLHKHTPKTLRILIGGLERSPHPSVPAGELSPGAKKTPLSPHPPPQPHPLGPQQPNVPWRPLTQGGLLGFPPSKNQPGCRWVCWGGAGG